jgi:non-heme chloroperoxidase
MSTFRTTDGTQIYFKDWGTGKPVLFSHGWPLDGDMWDSQMNFLAERGYRVIAFDRRGFGRSEQPWQGYDYDTFASDINDLINCLGLEDVTLVGFSMGGGDVTRYIANYGTARVAGLVLLGAVTPIFGKAEDYAGQTVSDGVLTQTLNIALLASLKGTLDCVTAFSETDFRPDMQKIDVPTLVIHGSNDQVVPFATTGKVAAEMIKGAELKVYENGPHGFAVTHQDQLNEDLLAFLQR